MDTTTKAGATPGPWRVKNGRWVVATRGQHEGEILIAPTYWMEAAQDEAAANARLIAAAPEMLAALRRAVLALAFAAESSPAMQDDYKAVASAISKATKGA